MIHSGCDHEGWGIRFEKCYKLAHAMYKEEEKWILVQK